MVRVALVTGAAQGIGRAIAIRLAQNGLDVALDDIESKKGQLDTIVNEIESLGRKAIALTEDVTKEDQVKQMVEQTVAILGRLDIVRGPLDAVPHIIEAAGMSKMVANAGVGEKECKPLAEANISAWDELWAINIRGVVLCYKYAARQMIKQGSGGRIIGASSICGLKGYAAMGDYCISKAAVRSLTESTAQELLEHNITVNAYAPGVIDTPMTRHVVDQQLGGPTSGTKHLLRMPSAKTGQAEDVASLVSYLASPDAHFITGRTMIVDGGATL